MTQRLPSGFRLIHLELAREAGHPAGSARDGYTLVLPVRPDGHIDEDVAHAHADACRVARIAGGETELSGLIRRESGGRWVFDYGVEHENPFRLSQERLEPGEYVSIRRGEDEHTYRVISLQPLPAGSKLTSPAQAG